MGETHAKGDNTAHNGRVLRNKEGVVGASNGVQGPARVVRDALGRHVGDVDSLTG